MRKTILLLLIGTLLLSGCAGAAVPPAPTAADPWPTHAPDATPYVRTFAGENSEVRPAEAETAESMEDVWRTIYSEFNNFYFRTEELEMFQALPQDEPYAFVPHTENFVLDEGEAMRMARMFSEKDGCEAEVIAMHQITDGLDDWGFLTVVTVTPARLFELSAEMETMMIEQFYPSVRERFDLAYWPDGEALS
ncbi:MAG: hypothetical protein IJV41_09920 [Oscillospiraceae bacterium]|nr:hypothetical protein [Oscillospiraceae bacterium]